MSIADLESELTNLLRKQKLPVNKEYVIKTVATVHNTLKNVLSLDDEKIIPEAGIYSDL